MMFYSTKLRKNINIPESKVKTVYKNVKGKRRKFAVGSYSVGGKTYEAWRILG